MKVESDLAPRDHSFAALNQRPGLFFSLVVVEARVVRMRADGGVHSLVRLASIDGALECAAVRITRSDVQDRQDSHRMRTRYNLFAISIKLGAINVRMRVDEHLSITSSARRSARLQ